MRVGDDHVHEDVVLLVHVEAAERVLESGEHAAALLGDDHLGRVAVEAVPQRLVRQLDDHGGQRRRCRRRRLGGRSDSWCLWLLLLLRLDGHVCALGWVAVVVQLAWQIGGVVLAAVGIHHCCSID